MFSQSLQNLLSEIGINIDRKIPKEIFSEREKYIIELYQNTGYELVPREVVLFFCYFNGLEISHRGHSTEFNLEHLMKYFPKSQTQYAEKLLEKQIFPIGTTKSGWYDLFSDENGAVYAFHIEGDELILYGENPFVALQNILQNTPLERKQV
ncbi:hypothetical protein CAPN001_13380 [Capnocytophaga stomatis]|uniref:SUKH-3 domain-containing protein n=1 Tax=Capnocytophaga stomatis TaxID=1848904 RepID=UPI00194FA9E1|nr:SUKH-3 domain-containing protein [Capnocytophaga stomatis]GIJ96769.1 hypothetical protein CAPN001_13380 [Capnocytophaga stomatis]